MQTTRPAAYLGVSAGASLLPHSVQVGHASAEFQEVAPWGRGLYCIDVGLLRSGRGGPVGSSELAACRDKGRWHQEHPPFPAPRWSVASWEGNATSFTAFSPIFSLKETELPIHSHPNSYKVQKDKTTFP